MTRAASFELRDYNPVSLLEGMCVRRATCLSTTILRRINMKIVPRLASILLGSFKNNLFTLQLIILIYWKYVFWFREKRNRKSESEKARPQKRDCSLSPRNTTTQQIWMQLSFVPFLHPINPFYIIIYLNPALNWNVAKTGQNSLK